MIKLAHGLSIPAPSFVPKGIINQESFWQQAAKHFSCFCFSSLMLWPDLSEIYFWTFKGKFRSEGENVFWEILPLVLRSAYQKRLIHFRGLLTIVHKICSEHFIIKIGYCLKSHLGVVEGRLRREGIYVYLSLIHAVVQQKLTEYYKAILVVVVQPLSRVWLFWGLLEYSPPGSSVHGILLARILEWVAISFSRGSSWPRDQTRISCLAARFFSY